VPRLIASGATVRAYDPKGMDEAAGLMADVVFCDDAYDAVAGADALIITTEWNEFRSLDLARVHGAMRTPLIVDLRNIYDPSEVLAAGFRYVGIGLGDLGRPRH
jgi:UDPglucose 6-dehydrogenase